MSRDYVKCCNCDYLGMIPAGAEECPRCKMTGALAWADDDHQDFDDYQLPEGVESICKRCGAVCDAPRVAISKLDRRRASFWDQVEKSKLCPYCQGGAMVPNEPLHACGPGDAH